MRVKIQILLLLFCSMNASAADFYITKEAPANPAKAISSIFVKLVTPMGPASNLQADLVNIVEEACIKSGYEAAAYFDMQAGPTALKSIRPSASYVLTFQCYR